MQSADTAPSLMDDAKFFEELGKLEPSSDDDVSEFPQLTAPVVAGVTPEPGPIRAPRPGADARGQGPQFMMPSEQNPPPPIAAAPKPSALHPAMAVVGFVLMMLVGAVAAVLVFHDRVERIVVQWQAAGR